MKESQRIFDSEKFLHHAVLSVPIMPELVVVHLLSGHLFDFSPRPKIAHFGIFRHIGGVGGVQKNVDLKI